MKAGMKVGDRAIYMGLKIEKANSKYFKWERCKHCCFEEETAICWFIGCHPGDNTD